MEQMNLLDLLEIAGLDEHHRAVSLTSLRLLFLHNTHNFTRNYAAYAVLRSNVTSFLHPEDLLQNFNLFYKTTNKEKQDESILRLMNISQPKRPRVDPSAARKDRTLSVTYFLLGKGSMDKVPVCKASFISVLGESRERLRLGGFIRNKDVSRSSFTLKYDKNNNNNNNRLSVAESLNDD